MSFNPASLAALDQMASSQAADSCPASLPAERPSEGLFVLPGGYCDDEGIVHREVQLEPLTGHDEEFLSKSIRHTCVAGIITGLLCRCVKRLGPVEDINASLVRKLLVGDRDYLMIKLREVTLGPRMDAVLSCPNVLCGKPLDVTIYLDEIQPERKPVRSRFSTMRLSPAASYLDEKGAEHRLVEFRLPTGADQEALAPLFAVDQSKALDQLFARCIRRIGDRSEIDEAFIAGLPLSTRLEIDTEIKERAPQVNIELTGICPECEQSFETPFDFLSFFTAEMRRDLSVLESHVHFLALHYHWSEDDILSLTRRKRQRYIELLQEELEQSNS